MIVRPDLPQGATVAERCNEMVERQRITQMAYAVPVHVRCSGRAD